MLCCWCGKSTENECGWCGGMATLGRAVTVNVVGGVVEVVIYFSNEGVG